VSGGTSSAKEREVKAEAKDKTQKRTKLTVSFRSLLLNLNLDLAGCGKTALISVCPQRSMTHNDSTTASRMLKKAVQKGRSE
jgi:hypothetical protein